MKLKFVKMQAQGNDFVILDGLHETLPELNEAFIKRLCDRHLGVGCDQLLVLQKHDEADALMLIYNADGSQAANCGNGLRCVGGFLMQNLNKEEVLIALADRVVTAHHAENGIRVNMGTAVIEEETSSYTDVNIGNAHRVYFEGQGLCAERNIELVSSYDSQQASIRIIERGSGETQACGSGACATAAALWKKLGKDGALHIHMPGGDVTVSQKHKDIYLEGKVMFVFSGDYTVSE